MRTIHRFGFAVAIIVLAGLASVVALPALPDPVVTSWDANGDPGGTMPAVHGVALLPLMMVGLVLLFAVIPRIDPLRENIATFRAYVDWLLVVLVAYLGILHVGIIAFNLGYSFDFTVLALSGVAILYYYIGILLPQAERNWFVGVRTPWTLSSDVVWERTHAYCGTLFKASGIIAAIGLVVGDYLIHFILIPVLLTTVFAVVYSYYLYEQVER